MFEIITGRFEWLELWTLDQAAAVRFYSQLMAWHPAIWDKNPAYTLFSSDYGPEAGCRTLTAESTARGARPRWLNYLSAADLAATVQRAEQQGARILVPPTLAPQVGHFAVLADPQGAQFGLLSRLQPVSLPVMPPHAGQIVWRELLTSNAEEALSFYQALFDWQLLERLDMGPKGHYLIIGANGQQFGGLMSVPIPGGPQWLAYTQVEDTDQLLSEARNAGAELCFGPQTLPSGGRIANLVDPQGVMFAVHSMPRGTVLRPPAAAQARPRVSKKSRSARRSGTATKSGKKRKIARKKRASVVRANARQGIKHSPPRATRPAKGAPRSAAVRKPTRAGRVKASTVTARGGRRVKPRAVRGRKS